MNGIVLDEGKVLLEMFGRLMGNLQAQGMTLETLSTQEVTAEVDFTTVDEQTMKVWEVLFDVKSGPTSGGNRIDPLIFDLNMDGKFDITGKNQTGDGELTGPTVNFDMDPNRQSKAQFSRSSSRNPSQRSQQQSGTCDSKWLCGLRYG